MTLRIAATQIGEVFIGGTEVPDNAYMAGLSAAMLGATPAPSGLSLDSLSASSVSPGANFNITYSGGGPLTAVTVGGFTAAITNDTGSVAAVTMPDPRLNELAPDPSPLFLTDVSVEIDDGSNTDSATMQFALPAGKEAFVQLVALLGFYTNDATTADPPVAGVDYVLGENPGDLLIFWQNGLSEVPTAPAPIVYQFYDVSTGQYSAEQAETIPVPGPTIVGDLSPTIAENQTAVTTLTINRRNGELPVLSGTDAAYFDIVAAGGDDFDVVFLSGPDYDDPDDSLGDNVYNFDVTIDNLDDDPTTESLAVTVTNVLEETTTAPADTTIYIPEAAAGLAHDSAELLAWLATANGTGGPVTNNLASKADPIAVGDESFLFSSPDAADDTATLTIAVDLAPTITGTTSFSIAENTVFQSDFTIANRSGQAPTLSGIDASYFTLTPLGGDLYRLAMTPKDYDNPVDDGEDNTYDVALNINDGINPAVTQPVDVTITDEADSDITPDAFSLGADVTGANPGAVTVRSFVVSGIDIGETITFNATGTAQVSNDNASWGATTDVQNGDTVYVRLAAGTYGSTVTGGANSGGVSDAFGITARAADLVPDLFSFNDRTGAELSTTYESNEITVSGVDAGQDIPVTVINGQYQVSTDGGNTFGAWTSAQTNVQFGYVIKVRVTSSGNYLTAVNALLDLNGVSDVFSVTTKSETALNPDPFDLQGPINRAIPGQVYYAEPVVISGLPDATSVDISCQNGEYSIDGGSYTASPGTVQNGQVVRFRVTAADNPYDTVRGVLTVGGYTTSFYVITGENVVAGDVGISAKVTNKETGVVYTNTTIKATVLTSQIGGRLLGEFIDWPIGSNGKLILPISSGTPGQSVFVIGVLADGASFAKNTLLTTLTP